MFCKDNYKSGNGRAVRLILFNIILIIGKKKFLGLELIP